MNQSTCARFSRKLFGSSVSAQFVSGLTTDINFQLDAKLIDFFNGLCVI